MTQTGAHRPHDGRGRTAAEGGHAEDHRQHNKGEVIFIWTNYPCRMESGNKTDLTSSVSVKDYCAHAGVSSQQCSSQSPWKKLFGLHRSGQSKHNVAPVGVHFTANANQLLTLVLWWKPKHRSITGLFQKKLVKYSTHWKWWNGINFCLDMKVQTTWITSVSHTWEIIVKTYMK